MLNVRKVSGFEFWFVTSEMRLISWLGFSYVVCGGTTGPAFCTPSPN